MLRLRRNVCGEVPRDLRGHARREGGRHRASRRGRRGVRRCELPDADRRPAVAAGIRGPRHASGRSAGVQAMTFERDARTALADGQLRGALRHATTLFGERRRAALATVPDWEGARDRARAIKAEIAALFADKLGIAPSDDVATLTAAARAALRRRFAEADLGISGVNFAVAETGTILILENEGNARLTTSLPRTHVALMGIEKVIPRFADQDVFLQLLPRSGTGQVLTAYQSLLTGTKRRPEDEGPGVLHIVVLDNGRSRMLASAVTRQSLACIRCGACLNACPVYRQIGGHAYGSVYPGPIGAVLSPQLFGLARSAALPYASSLCGACRDVCPVKIDIPALLLHLRAQVVAEGVAVGKGHLRERLAFWIYATVMVRPRLFAWLMRAVRSLRIMPPLGAWTKWRDLRPLAPRSFREQWRAGLGDQRGPDA